MLLDSFAIQDTTHKKVGTFLQDEQMTEENTVGLCLILIKFIIYTSNESIYNLEFYYRLILTFHIAKW